MTYSTSLFSFIETRLFSKLVAKYLTDDAYASLQQSLVADPEAGALIAGSGGIRKLRWPVSGKGKRGGVRVIYYAKVRDGVIWMLTMYAKTATENIPAHVLKQIKEELDG